MRPHPIVAVSEIPRRRRPPALTPGSRFALIASAAILLLLLAIGAVLDVS